MCLSGTAEQLEPESVGAVSPASSQRSRLEWAGEAAAECRCSLGLGNERGGASSGGSERSQSEGGVR